MTKSNPIRVLYMEDDRALARLVQKKLQLAGYLVDVAYDGEQGLAMYAAGTYDVLAVDQSMPGHDGLEVIRILASRGKMPPAIMITGSGNENIAVEAMKLGLSDYIVKDVAGGYLNLLPAVIDRVIEQRRLAQEKQRAQEEIRCLKQQIEFILGATKTGLDIIDSDFNLRYVDPQWQQAYGDHAGRKCYEYLEGRDKPCVECSLVAALKTKQAVVVEKSLPKENGRPVQVTSIPYEDDEGRWLVAQVNVDISQRKLMERELAQAQKLEAIGQLAAGIAHEINTPTQYVGDNTRFLQDTFGDLDRLLGAFDRLLQAAKDDAVTEELLAEVEAEVRKADFDYAMEEIPRAIRQSLEGISRVAQIVRSMKEFAHPGGEQKQAIDLNHAINNALAVSRNEWKYVADLVTDLDPNLPPVACLPGDINQVVLNLIVNAAQAIAEANGEGSHDKGTITVRTRRHEDWVEIQISDTGAGIPEEIRSKVFDPFFTTKEVGKGTGQGLSIVRTIVVDKHDGTISFQTQSGKGTTFIIRLPITDESVPVQDARHEEIESAAAQTG